MIVYVYHLGQLYELYFLNGRLESCVRWNRDQTSVGEEVEPSDEILEKAYENVRNGKYYDETDAAGSEGGHP